MGRKFEDNGTPERGKKLGKTESPNVSLGVKRTINSAVAVQLQLRSCFH